MFRNSPYNLLNIHRSGVPGLWLGLCQKSVDTEYHCAKEHKLSHATHGLDKGLAACAPLPGRVNRCDIGNGKFWKMSGVSRRENRTGEGSLNYQGRLLQGILPIGISLSLSWKMEIQTKI